MNRTIQTMLAFTLALTVGPAIAQSKPAAAAPDTMQILREKLKADKKLVVAANMDLKEAEAKAFWPLYDEYQKELEKLNKRTADLIRRYAREYNSGDLKNDEARKLISDFLDNETAATTAKRNMVQKVSKVLTGKKTARYLQIENKIRAALQYELADSIPLVP
jgi:hypothetical protein